VNGKLVQVTLGSAAGGVIMALSREEVNRLLADAAEARRGQIHQMWVDTRLSEEQIDELWTVDAQDRRDRAREMVALEGRPWNREMATEIEYMNNAAAGQRQATQASPPSGRSAKVEATGPMAERDRQLGALREIAVPLDDLNVPPTKP
jgi:hypothetical protein